MVKPAAGYHTTVDATLTVLHQSFRRRTTHGLMISALSHSETLPEVPWWKFLPQASECCKLCTKCVRTDSLHRRFALTVCKELCIRKRCTYTFPGEQPNESVSPFRWTESANGTNTYSTLYYILFSQKSHTLFLLIKKFFPGLWECAWMRIKSAAKKHCVMRGLKRNKNLLKN